MNLAISLEIFCVHEQVEFKPRSWWVSKIAFVSEHNFIIVTPPFFLIKLLKPTLFYCAIRCCVMNSEVVAGPVLSAIHHSLSSPIKTDKEQIYWERRSLRICRSDAAHDMLDQSKLILLYFMRLSLMTFFFTETFLTVCKQHLFKSKKQEKRER